MAGNLSSPIANWTLLDFDYGADCNRSALFWTSHYSNVWSPWSSLENFPYAQFVDFVRHAAPDPFLNVSRGVIVDWIDGLNFTIRDERGAMWVWARGLDTCDPEVCYNLDWEGNPDLAGIGVLFSYVIEVVLATVFILVLGSQYLTHLYRGQTYTTRVRSPIWAAFQTSLGLFWDTSFLFNLAVTVAALVAVGETYSFYINDFARLASALTWSVIALTWPLYRPTCHHRRARSFGLFVASALCATLMWLTYGRDAARAKAWGTTFEWLCYQRQDGSTDKRTTGSTLGTIVVHLSGSMALLYIGVWLGSRAVEMYYRYIRPHFVEPASYPQPASNGSSRPALSRQWRWTVGILVVGWMVVAFTLMYLSIVTFMFKRDMTALVAGPSFQENYWGFGQVMSLAVWFPTGMDFLLVVRGNLKALKYRLPRGVDVDILDERREARDRERHGVTVSVEDFQDKYYAEEDRPPDDRRHV